MRKVRFFSLLVVGSVVVGVVGVVGGVVVVAADGS